MDIQRIDGYEDPRFPQEVLNQHGAFLADGVPWAFRIVSGQGAVVTAAQPFDGDALAEVAGQFRFYAGHITDFFDGDGTLLLSLPPVEQWEVDIDSLQPSQFSVDKDKCAAVDGFLHTAADVVIPIAELPDGTLCSMDGHTRLYTAWQKGIRAATVFRCSDGEMAAAILPFVDEARRRGIFHVRDMALYPHEEQEEKWTGWCDAYFAAQDGGREPPRANR